MTISVMLTAVQARAKAQNDLVIFREVRDIEEAILTASVAGEYQASVSTSTMTDTNDGIETARKYFSVWQASSDDRAKDRQMSTVVNYFSDLGYVVERRTNLSTGDTFTWHIYW